MIEATKFIECLTKEHDRITAESAMDMYDQLRGLSEEEKQAKKDEILERELKYDAIADTEDKLGIYYKDPVAGDAVKFLSMAAMWGSNARKNEILLERKDTTMSCSLDYYLEVIEENGFERVLEIPFNSRWGNVETYYIYWHPDGLLLSFDTFNGNHVNGGKVFYNWETTKREHNHRITSSYSPIEYRNEDGDFYWCIAGDHDCREALIHNMNQLRANGNFLKVWRKSPFMWLLHFGDTEDKNYDYKKINAERIAMLPQHVQDAIKCEKCGKERAWRGHGYRNTALDV